MHFPNHIRSDRNSRRLRPCLQPARTYRWRPALEPLENRLLLNDTPVGILSNEPHLAVNPLNPANVVVSDVNNLAISTDAGTSFSLPIAAPMPAGYGGSGDDVVAFDSRARLFWSYLAGNGSDLTIVVQQINPLTGAAVGSPVDVAPGNHSDDKVWIAADANPASPFRDNIYLHWTRFDNTPAEEFFSRSTDGGVTFSSPVAIASGSGEGFRHQANVAVAPNGDLYLAYHTDVCASLDDGRVEVLRDTTGGADLVAGKVDQKNDAFTTGQSSVTCNRQPQGGPLSYADFLMQGSSVAYVVPDPVRPGRIYVIGNDDPNDNPNNGDDGDVVMATSTDDGLHWTHRTISHGPFGSLQVFPQGAMDPRGNLAVFWYDTREGRTNAAAKDLLDVYATTSSDGGETFSNDFRVNDPTNHLDTDAGAPNFNNDNPPTMRIGEYNGIAVTNGIAYVDWTGNTFDSSTPPQPMGQQIFFNTFVVRNADLVPGVRWQSKGVLLLTGNQDYLDERDTFRLTIDPANPALLDVFINDPGPQPTIVFPVALLQHITVNGLGGGDTINIEDVPVNVTVTVINSDADVVNVGKAGHLQSILGSLILNSFVSAGTVNLDDSNDPVVGTVTLTGDSILGPTTGTISFGGFAGHLTVFGGDNDGFLVQATRSQGTTELFVGGGVTAVTVGLLNQEQDLLTGQLIVHGGTGSTELTFNDLSAPVLSVASYSVDGSTVTRQGLEFRPSPGPGFVQSDVSISYDYITSLNVYGSSFSVSNDFTVTNLNDLPISLTVTSNHDLDRLALDDRADGATTHSASYDITDATVTRNFFYASPIPFLVGPPGLTRSITHFGIPNLTIDAANDQAGNTFTVTGLPPGTATLNAATSRDLFTGSFSGDFAGSLTLTGFPRAALDVFGDFRGSFLAPSVGTLAAPIDHIGILGSVQPGSRIKVGYLKTLSVSHDLNGAVDGYGPVTDPATQFTLGPVTVGGTWGSSGSITAPSIQSINMQPPSVFAGSATETMPAADFQSLQLGTVAGTGRITAGTIVAASVAGDLAGRLAVSGSAGTLAVGGSLTGSVSAATLGTLSVEQDLTGHVTVSASLGSLTVGGNLVGDVTAPLISSAAINGTAVADTFVLSRTAVSLNGVVVVSGTYGALTVNGLGGNDRFILDGGNLPATVGGGTGDDTVQFNDGAGITGSFDGQDGTDTLDYQPYTTPTFVDLGTGQATGVAGGVRNVELVLGATVNTTVTNTLDSGPGSFRQVLLAANAHPGVDRITFAIPGAGVHTIGPMSPLPDITDPVTIDGYTQPGTMPNTRAVGDNAVLLVELDGRMAGHGVNGLHITAGSSVVRGLMIDNFLYSPDFTVGGTAILLEGKGGNVIEGNWFGLHGSGNYEGRSNENNCVFVGAGSTDNLIGGLTPAARNILSGSGGGVTLLAGPNNRVQGNYVGTDPSGTVAVGNLDGIADAGPGNLIGGTSPGAGNVASGNIRSGIFGGFGGVTQGNLIGTDASGTGLLSNGSFGIFAPSGELIGGTEPGARNVITGTSGIAIFLWLGSGNRVQGNFIGTDVTGTAPLGHPADGIAIQSSNDNVIGGTGPGEGNVIANCFEANVYLLAGSTGNRIEGNRIGTDLAGTAALGVSGVGVLLANGAANNTVGGAAPGAGNLISGNGNHGVFLHDPDVTGNVVEGNSIGLSAAGTPLGNGGDGVHISLGAHDNRIGEAATGALAGVGNTIAFNDPGIAVRDATTVNNSLCGNVIFGNAGKGIDLAGSGVTLQPPSLSTAEAGLDSTVVTGSFVARATFTYTLDFYYVAVQQVRVVARRTLTTDAAGRAGFSFSLPASNAPEAVAITATDAAGNTSEFSPTVSVLPPAVLQVDSVGRLSYTAGPGAANRLTISQTGGIYTFHDDGELILASSTDVAVTVSGSGTHAVTVSRGVQSISVDIGDQPDTVNVQSIAVPTTLDDTGGGDDTVNVGAPVHPIFDLGMTVGGIAATLSVNNTAGYTTLNVNDSGNSDPTVIFASIDSAAIRDLTPAPISYRQDKLTALNVWLGSGPVRVTVANTPDNGLHPTTTLNAGPGADVVTVVGTAGPLVLAGGRGPVVALGSEGFIEGTVEGIHGAVTITSADALVTVDDRRDSGPRHPTLTGSTITELAPAPITFPATGSGQLQVRAGSGGNTFTVQDLPHYTSSSSSNVELDTGTGGDTVNVLRTSGSLLIAPPFGGDETVVNVGHDGRVQEIQGEVEVNNPRAVAAAVLNVIDSADTDPRTVQIISEHPPDQLSGSIKNEAVTGLGAARISVGFQLVSAALSVYGGGKGNAFRVVGTKPLTSTNLYCGSGDDSVNVFNNDGPLLVDGLGGNDEVAIARRPVGGPLPGIMPVVVRDFATDGSPGHTSLFVDYAHQRTLDTIVLDSDSLTAREFPGDSATSGDVYWDPAGSGIDSLSVYGPGESGDQAFVLVSDTPPFPTQVHQSEANTEAWIQATTGELSVEANEVHVGDLRGSPTMALTGLRAPVHVIDITTTGTIKQVVSDSEYIADDRLAPFPGSYDDKILEFTSGANKGSRFLIYNYEGVVERTFFLQYLSGPAGFNPPIAGDTFRIYTQIDSGMGPQLFLEDRDDPDGRTATIGVDNVQGLAPHAAITFATTAPRRLIDTTATPLLVTVTGGRGDDAFTVVGIPSGGLIVDGGAGRNVLQGPNAVLNRWVVGNSQLAGVFDAGTLNDVVGFSSFRELRGGDAVDFFSFVNGGGVSGLMDGRGGTNTLFGPNTLNTWRIDQAGGGTLSGAGRFTSIQNLVGGAADDGFAFLAGGSVAGTVDGGPGINTLDYSRYNGDITVDLALHLATGVNGGAPQSVFQIRNVFGGIGNCLIVGDTQANVLVGGTGRNLIIGGGGSDTIRGGGGDNLLIGGTTSYDLNLAALQAVLKEFLQTYDASDPLNDFSIRANNIRDGKGTLSGSGFYLDKGTGKRAATVFADGASDVFTAGGGLNWYFLDANDAAILGQTLAQKKNDRQTRV